MIKEGREIFPAPLKFKDKYKCSTETLGGRAVFSISRNIECVSGFSLRFMKPALIAYGPSTMYEFPQLGLDAEEELAPMHFSVYAVPTVFKVGGPVWVVNWRSVQIVGETTEGVAYTYKVTVT